MLRDILWLLTATLVFIAAGMIGYFSVNWILGLSPGTAETRWALASAGFIGFEAKG
jgi:hypothetical protein